MDLLFKILAVILAGIAAYFVWRKNGDGAFISAVLGAVCFFISIRFQVKGRLQEREAAREAVWEEEEEMRRREEENFDSQNVLKDISANDEMNRQIFHNEQLTTNNEPLTTDKKRKTNL